MNTEQRLELRRKVQDDARRRFWAEYDRDSYECPACERDDVPFEVHHRDGDWLNGHPINLRGTCHQCHAGEHRRREAVERVEAMKAEFAELVAPDETEDVVERDERATLAEVISA